VKIHEYQGKAILAKYGVAVPRGEVAFTPDEARAIAERLGGGVVVVKAQIHAGGRGKGGGVKVARNGPAEAQQLAAAMLGMTLVTHQTGPEGRVVKRVLVEEGLQMKKEHTSASCSTAPPACPVMMASSEGGVEIEGRPRHPRVDQEGLHRPGRRPAGLPGAPAGVRDRPRARVPGQGRQADARHL
jgi:succinyl-CoA synthetase beta subunit